MTKKLLLLVFSTICAMNAENLAPQPRIVQETPSHETSLRVMTYNVRRDGKEERNELTWRHRLRKLITIIKGQNPDVLHLQEPVAGQVRDIQNGLGSDYAWVGESRGHRWPGFDTAEYNPIFYKPSVLALIAHGTYSINKPFSYLGALFKGKSAFKETGALPRIATWALFQVRATGQYFFSVNTHFDNKQEQARAHNMAKLLAGLQTVRSNNMNLPVILTGDFNCDAPKVFAQELGKVGLLDAKQVAQRVTGPQHTGSAFLPKLRKKPIDHILLAAGTAQPTVKSHHTHNDQTNASDHNPRIIDVVW